jgi:hypothetical protein
MLTRNDILHAMRKSPQRAAGVRRLADALGVEWRGMPDAALAAAVAKAAMLDSLRGAVVEKC